MRRVPSSGKPAVRPGNAPEDHLGPMGVGAGGCVYLLPTEDRVQKVANEDELRFLQRLTQAPGTEGQSYVPKLFDVEPVKSKPVAAARRRKKRGAKPVAQYKVQLELCELGSLEQQALSGAVASGVISRQAYLAYMFQVISQTNDALAYVHDNGILHCDIKPHNIFVTADGSVKLGDYGHAVDCAPGDTIDVAADRMVGVGTPYYMPPESLADFVLDPLEPMRLNAKSDIWGLGVLLGKFIGHEVGLVPEAELDGLAAIPGFSRIGHAAIAKMDEMDEWKTLTDEAAKSLEGYCVGREASAVYTEDEMQAVLLLLVQLLTAPEALRPSSQELKELLLQMKPFMPVVLSVKTNAEDDVALTQRRIVGIEVDARSKTLHASRSSSDISMQGTPSLLLASPMSISPQVTPELPPIKPRRRAGAEPMMMATPPLMSTPPSSLSRRFGSAHTRQVSVADALSRRKVGSMATPPLAKAPEIPAGKMTLSRVGPLSLSLLASAGQGVVSVGRDELRGMPGKPARQQPTARRHASRSSYAPRLFSVKKPSRPAGRAQHDLGVQGEAVRLPALKVR
ncbi:MAG: protein kinase [Coxiellaceae bacterium]|nr:protein kinase [Coxiellaceae bacterium]